MTTREYFLQNMDLEEKAFVSVINALPEDKLDWKPDPKSRSAKEMMNIFHSESMAFKMLAETKNLDPTKMDMEKVSIFETPKEASEAFSKNYKAWKDVVSSMSDSDFESPAKFMNWEAPLAVLELHLLSDMVHHRGQLATYIRPMGGKVPQIYGPSADFPM